MTATGGELRVVNLHTGATWDSVAAAARALGVDLEAVRAWIADPVKPFIVCRYLPPPLPAVTRTISRVTL